MRLTVACTALLLALPATSPADVILHSRTTEFRSAHNFPGAQSSQSYSDFVSVNQLSPTGAGVVNLTTFHNESFSSTASTSAITATMLGTSGYGPINSRDRWNSSTWFAVVFQITGNSQQVTLLINGTITPHQPGPVTGFSLSIRNLATGITVFDALRDRPPVMTDGFGQIGWLNADWGRSLDPGTYLLTAEARAETSYLLGGGTSSFGGSSTTSVTFNFAFGTQPVPSIALSAAPTPSAAALLALPAASLRRRRR